MQKSFLSRSLFPSEYQLPITLRAGGPAAEERRRRKRNCPGSLQSFLRLRYNARQEKRKEINQIGEGRVEGLL